ncbi:PAS domain-containing protein [Dechloromonas sp. A34]|uniref:PAS domain-containing protein n=1 Tax=Dechloromonas sp. A34 TaxID=447588 RepID=UPI002248BDFB|nr:PAS domain-containing protein [Dechloromonas sp. A34]
MRNNQPANPVEVALDDHVLVVSKTDLLGNITYVNRDFVEISGFSEAELLGQPHSVLRHPDMPLEVFEDMWRDLKAGRPWAGMIKNRCKNGDYYWVWSNATPIRESGQASGYIWVRRKASPQQIQWAEATYTAFREKRSGRSKILHGGVVAGGLAGAIRQWLLNASSSQKIVLGMLVGLLLILGGRPDCSVAMSRMPWMYRVG